MIPYVNWDGTDHKDHMEVKYHRPNRFAEVTEKAGKWSDGELAETIVMCANEGVDFTFRAARAAYLWAMILRIFDVKGP
jgi:hypothetical protein